MSGTSNHVPDHWYRRIFNWHLLRGFGQSKVGAVSIATPFVGYAILYHDKLQPYLGGLGGSLGLNSSSQCCGPWIDFIDRLHLLYLGALCLGLGTITFKIFADKAIKSFDNISEYVEKQSISLTARNLRSMVVTIRSKRQHIAEQLISRAAWLDREQHSLKKASESFAGQKDNTLCYDVLRSYYNVKDRYSARGWLYFTTLLYGLGFTLLAIPGVFFTFRVLCTMIF